MKFKSKFHTTGISEVREKRRKPDVNENAKAYYVMILPFVAVIAALGISLFALVNWIVMRG